MTALFTTCTHSYLPGGTLPLTEKFIPNVFPSADRHSAGAVQPGHHDCRLGLGRAMLPGAGTLMEPFSSAFGTAWGTVMLNCADTEFSGGAPLPGTGVAVSVTVPATQLGSVARACIPPEQSVHMKSTELLASCCGLMAGGVIVEVSPMSFQIDPVEFAVGTLHW
jgi:hypothetical protein